MKTLNSFCGMCGAMGDFSIHKYCIRCGNRHDKSTEIKPYRHRDLTRSPANTFLDNANLGINRWWVWTLGTLLILIIWNLLGFIPTWITCNSLNFFTIESFYCDSYIIMGISHIPNFVAANSTFLIGLFGIYYVIKFIHKKAFKHLITFRKEIDYKRTMYSASLMGAILSILLILSLSSENPDLKFQSPKLAEYILFSLMVFALTPIQVLMEEVFFRGYVIHGIHLIIKNKSVNIIISSALFTVLHLANPEPYEYGFMPYISAIFIMAIFLSLITILDGGIEIAAGLHLMNNMWIFMIANTETSVLNSPSLFIIPIQKYALMPDIPVQVIIDFVLLVLLNKKYKWFSWRKMSLPFSLKNN